MGNGRILGINHIGIAVRDLDEAIKSYAIGLGVEPEETRRMPDQGASVAMLGAGTSKLELLAPIGTDGTIAKFLKSRGEGLHHICLEVENIEEALRNLSAKQVRLIDIKARQGLEGKIAFIHPSAMNGVLVELVETPKDRPIQRC